MKLAVFLPNWVGDAVMATPALRALRQHFPNAELLGVMSPVIAEVLKGLDHIDRVILHESRGKTEERSGRAVIRQLKIERCELGVLFPNSWRSAWMAWRGGIRRRVGFGRDGRGILLTDRLRPKSRVVPNPVLDEYLRLANHLGCETDSLDTELAVTPEDQLALDRFWMRQDPEMRQRGIVCLNTGGAFGPAKNWPRNSFAELSRRIFDLLGYTVLIVCGPAEKEESRRIARAAHRPGVLSLSDEPLSIGLSKAAIRESRLLVTTDSGPRHFAQPFGVPLITLFGPTHIAWSETHYNKAVHLNVTVPCGPCQQRVCPTGDHRCMRELSIDRVFANVKHILLGHQIMKRTA